MKQLSGRRYWIVGASAGIGRALARELADCGARIVLSARNDAALRAVADELPGCGHEVLPMDVTSASSVAESFASIGQIDGLVYLAGAYEPMSARQPDIAALDQMVEVNLGGAFRVLSHVVPAFLARNAGHIVLTASVSGYRGLPSAWGYGATKAALIHLAENLKCDLRHTAIDVQVCNPGFVETRLTAKNEFAMPFILSPEAAAGRMRRGMQRRRFEIAFPRRFVLLLRLISLLPYGAYFWTIGRLAGPAQGRAQGNSSASGDRVGGAGRRQPQSPDRNDTSGE